MRNTLFGMGMLCRSNRLFLLKVLIFFFFLSLQSLIRVQAQQWSSSGSNVYLTTSTNNVGIGTQTPGAKLDVQGNLLFFTGANQMYLNGGTTFDGTKAGLRVNGGGLVLNSSNSGKLFLNRDVSAETWIESTNSSGVTTEIATFKANASGSSGLVGIGTTTPRTTLDVNGTFYMNRPPAMGDGESTLGIPAGSYLGIAPTDMSATYPGYVLFLFPDHNSFRIGTNYDGHLGSSGYQDLQFGRYYGDAYLTIKDGGNVLIGKTSQTNTGYKLDVNGNVRSNQVVVNTTGADFVFDPGYHLPALNEIEDFVRKERHLPGISPAVQMQKEGLDLGQNQTRLLAKIEELTLYLIEQDKEIKRLKQQNKELESIKQRLDRLEQQGQSK